MIWSHEKKKVTQRNNYQRYLRIETKYIECIAGKAEAFFFKAFAQTSYNLKRNMNAGLYKIWLAEIKTPSIQEKSYDFSF